MEIGTSIIGIIPCCIYNVPVLPIAHEIPCVIRTHYCDTIDAKIIAQQLIELCIACTHGFSSRQRTIDRLRVIRIGRICRGIGSRQIVYLITDQLMDLRFGLVDRAARMNLLLHRLNARIDLIGCRRAGAARRKGIIDPQRDRSGLYETAV